ncbi:hypothetical protein [Bradyrhizobium sp. USDA 3650]
MTPRAPSAEMLSSAAYNALGGSARSVLRILLEEFSDAGGQPVALGTAFFETGGVVANALSTGARELVALGFISIWTSGTASRTFAPSDGWRAIADQATALALLAEARAKTTAKRPVRRPRATSTEAAAVDAGNGRLPDGIRRSVYPAMPWALGQGGER